MKLTRPATACAVAALLISGAVPARAQYLDYNSNQAPVEMNLDIIDGTAPPAQPVAPVTHEPIPAPVKKKTAQAAKLDEDVPQPDEKIQLASPPPPTPSLTLTPPQVQAQEAPAVPPPAPQKKLVLKPVFTDTLPEADTTAAPVAPATPPEEEPASTPPPPVPAKPDRSAETHVQKPVPPVREAAPEESVPPPLEQQHPVTKTETEKPVTKATTEQPAISAPAVPLPSDLMLEFKGNGCDLTPDLQTKLDNIAKQLTDLQDTRLQVRAFATGEDGNTSSARRISLSRALSVRSYLMDKGIKPNRIDVRALGTETDHGPLDRVDIVFVK